VSGILFFKDHGEVSLFIKRYITKKPKIQYLKNAFETILIKNRG